MLTSRQSREKVDELATTMTYLELSTEPGYMDSFVGGNRLDTVILGCTHYPLIKENISRIYPRLQIINPSSVVIGEIRRILTERDALADGSDFTNVFYASDLSENFINMIDHIFADVDEDKKVKFVNFDLEKERLYGLL